MDVNIVETNLLQLQFYQKLLTRLLIYRLQTCINFNKQNDKILLEISKFII